MLLLVESYVACSCIGRAAGIAEEDEAAAPPKVERREDEEEDDEEAICLGSSQDSVRGGEGSDADGNGAVSLSLGI